MPSNDKNRASGCLIFYVGRDSYFLSHRLPTARAAMAQGHKVIVIAGDSGLGDAITAAGATLYPRWIGQDKIPAFSIIIGFVQLLVTAIRHRAGVIQIVGLRYALIGLLASLLLPWKRFVISINGLGFLFVNEKPKMAYRIMRRIITSVFTIVTTLRKIDITFQNSDDLDAFCEMTTLRQARIHLIRGSGVDATKYEETPMPKGSKIIFGVASRMIRMKGVEDIITAFRSLIDEGLPVSLQLAGDVDEANPDSLNVSDIQNICVDGEIEWVGYLSDVMPFWSNCHVAMLGSHGGEGLPMSLLIPAAMQRPIICSDTSGNRDLVSDGVNGYLYPAGDITALKEAIKKIVKNDLKLMGEESRKLIHQQGMDALSIQRQFIDLYKS